MLKDVTSVQPLEQFNVRLPFEDGTAGVLDLATIISFQGIFEPLRELSFFRKVRVDPELGSITWPNGADLDPDVLYSLITGTPILAEPK